MCVGLRVHVSVWKHCVSMCVTMCACVCGSMCVHVPLCVHVCMCACQLTYILAWLWPSFCPLYGTSGPHIACVCSRLRHGDSAFTGKRECQPRLSVTGCIMLALRVDRTDLEKSRHTQARGALSQPYPEPCPVKRQERARVRGQRTVWRCWDSARGDTGVGKCARVPWFLRQLGRDAAVRAVLSPGV